MGEFTQDIKTLPTPDNLYAKKLQGDRDKLFSEREGLANTIETIQAKITKKISNSNGRKSITLYYNNGILEPFNSMESQTVKEARLVLRKWLGLYGYRLVGRTIIPIRKGFWGRFTDVFRAYAALCDYSDKYIVLTFFSALSLLVGTIALSLP